MWYRIILDIIRYRIAISETNHLLDRRPSHSRLHHPQGAFQKHNFYGLGGASSEKKVLLT
jgi:hypothetical protein